MKKNKETIHSLFQPTFGNRPEKYIGRDGVIEQFMSGLREPVGSTAAHCFWDNEEWARQPSCWS